VDTARDLAAHLQFKVAKALAFNVPPSFDTADMLRKDLTAAGIAYKDDQGAFADFHALRHTFVSNLADGRVHPKTAQLLARHSDINLTMSRYTHMSMERQAEALLRLPDLSGGPAAEGAAAVRNGTTGAPAEISAEFSAEMGGFSCKTVDDGGQRAENTENRKMHRNTVKAHDNAPSVKLEVEPPARFERATCGLQNRCTTPVLRWRSENEQRARHRLRFHILFRRNRRNSSGKRESGAIAPA
jgi:hypothetical protein